MTTSPTVPFVIEGDGTRVTVADAAHAEMLVGMVALGETGFRVYHPKPGVEWCDIRRALDS